MSIVPSPSPAHQDAPILCRASVESDGYGNRTLQVISPRTRHKLRIGAGWWSELPDPRMIGRVAQAQSMGRKTAFTRDELAALAAIEQKIMKATTPLPRGGRWSNSWSRSRRSRHRRDRSSPIRCTGCPMKLRTHQKAVGWTWRLPPGMAVLVNHMARRSNTYCHP